MCFAADLQLITGTVVLRAFSFIARLPLKAIKAQEGVKKIIQDFGRSMIEHGAHESKNNDLLSTIGSYLSQFISNHNNVSFYFLARLATAQDSDFSTQELLDHVDKR